MEKIDMNMGEILGEIGCKFRSNIENHIKDYKLQKEDDVEWLLEPLDAISHSPDIVLDAFKHGTRWEWFYQLYFHNKIVRLSYIPYDEPVEKPRRVRIEGNTIHFPDPDEIEERPKPNPYSKTMLIAGTPEENAMADVPGIWEDLNVQFTKVGVWQAVLLNETIALFPKGWHGDYITRTYVFSRADMQQIIDNKKSRYDYTDEEIERLNAYWRFLDMTPHFDQYKKSNYDKLVSYLEREDILPSVEISGDKAIVSYYYWSEWSGFCRARVPVERCGQSVTIGEQTNEVLVAYDCGICY
ncbi:MAG: hypothetical protein II905_05355 [Muribaculaceae bacterium]|nr:hypothetical protein [Muribaculaceae bacterium]